MELAKDDFRPKAAGGEGVMGEPKKVFEFGCSQQ